MYDLPEWSLHTRDDPTCIGTHNTISSLHPMNVYRSLVSATHADVDTANASLHLNRKRKTLRPFACLDSGPIRPLSTSGHLAWPCADLDRPLIVNARIDASLSNQA